MYLADYLVKTLAILNLERETLASRGDSSVDDVAERAKTSILALLARTGPGALLCPVANQETEKVAQLLRDRHFEKETLELAVLLASTASDTTCARLIIDAFREIEKNE